MNVYISYEGFALILVKFRLEFCIDMSLPFLQNMVPNLFSFCLFQKGNKILSSQTKWTFFLYSNVIRRGRCVFKQTVVSLLFVELNLQCVFFWLILTVNIDKYKNSCDFLPFISYLYLTPISTCGLLHN